MDRYYEIIKALWSVEPLTIVYWVAATFFFWFLFATVMRLRDKRAKFKKKSWQYRAITAAGYLLLVVSYPYDVLYNLIYGTLMFWQLPRRWEWTFTARLQRCVHLATWRGQLARFLCRYFVEPWDADHCGQWTKP